MGMLLYKHLVYKVFYKVGSENQEGGWQWQNQVSIFLGGWVFVFTKSKLQTLK